MILAFEGIDGSGKTTQCQLLLKYLEAVHIDASLTGPFLTPYGRDLRDFYLQNAAVASPLTQVLLLASGIHEVSARKLVSAPSSELVILDRWVYSTYAYHGIGLDIGPDAVEAILTPAALGVVPDVTFLLDVPAVVATSRRAVAADRIEDLPPAFHEKVRQAYLDMSARFSEFVVLDAQSPPHAIHDTVVRHVLRRRKEEQG